MKKEQNMWQSFSNNEIPSAWFTIQSIVIDPENLPNSFP